MNDGNSREHAGGSNRRRAHPKEKANFLSRFTFLYNLGIFWNTYKKGTFQEEELFEVLRKCKAENAGNELEKCLKEDLKRHGTLSLSRILWKCYGIQYLVLGLIQMIVRSIVIITIPMTLSKVILYFQPGQEELTKTDGIYFAVLLILLNFFSITYIHNYLLILSEMGIKVRTAFCSVIFRKSLRLTSTSLSNVSIGKIITLMTKDVAAIENFIFYCNDVWVGVLQAAIVFYLIFSKMGVATLVGMGFFVLVIPVQVIIGKITSKLRIASSKKTDERLQATKESLSGVGIIKMNTWEEVFEDKINKSRNKEMAAVLKIFLTKTSVLLIGSLTSKIAYYLLLTTYVVFGKIISAELIYYVTTLFLRIRHALNVAIPVGVTVIADMSASLKRIEELMTAEEIIGKDVIDSHEEKPQVILIDVTVELKGNPVLKNVTLNVDSGLVVVSGPIGSGKTTLLKTILEENEIQSGSLLKFGSISYASQEPWIFPSTLRQNIIFDEAFDEERYQTVLNICALNFDIQRFSLGDDLKIGDKGTNLSRGQKSRISLARAVYKKADIYLIDDCLTSLDANVQKHVFQKCIKEFLGDKICIFVTQNLRYVEENDEVVIMDEGKIIFSQKLLKENDMELKTILKQEKRLEKLIEINNNTVEYEPENITEVSALLNPKSKKHNMYQERKKSGKVDFQSYKKYGKYGGGLLVIIIIFIFFIGEQFSKSYTEKILSNWVNIIHQNTSKENNTETSGNITKSDLSLKLYSIFTLTTTVLSIFSAFLLFNFSRKASLNLHNYMINSVVHATMTFFDEHLIGNILNRFSKDMAIVDEQIPFAIYEFLEICLGLCGIVILITMVNAVFIIPIITIFVMLYLLRKLYMPTGRNLQRLDTATRSPVLGYLNSSLEGLTTIRAFRAEEVLAQEFDRHQDLYTSANYTSKCCQRAFGYYLDVCCTIFMGVIVAVFIIFDKETSVGDVGLAITQAFMLNGIVQYGIRQWADIENKMTSVERILEYTEIEKEVEDSRITYTAWPEANIIKYENVIFSYGDDYVLKNISLTVNSREKIGIVGRTGSGKSSLVSLLFRLYDYQGRITIGGQDIKNIPLKTLRSNISIVSQDPMLFSGTIRINLDPTNKFSDEDIWKAIHTIKLENLITSLDLEMTDSGSNLSAGQRQLICLTRCILSKNKIVILDEATSDIDQESENLINNVLEKHVGDCTVIVIAHRLKTILNCDRVLVIHEGEIVETGEVRVLGRDERSVFYSMLQKSGLLDCV